MSPPPIPSIKAGERAVISGRTGSGKSALGAYFLNRSRQHWIILNPKHTAAYRDLPGVNVLQGFDARKVNKSIESHQFTCINFTGEESNPAFMDGVIAWLCENYTNIGVCCDELYTLHTRGNPGPGLIALLTRGRELKQSFLGMTQRPAWISVFTYSEASYIIGMDLTTPADRKRLYENTGEAGFLKRLSAYYWRFYNVGNDAATFWGPVPLLKTTEAS